MNDRTKKFNALAICYALIMVIIFGCGDNAPAPVTIPAGEGAEFDSDRIVESIPIEDVEDCQMKLANWLALRPDYEVEAMAAIGEYEDGDCWLVIVGRKNR